MEKRALGSTGLNIAPLVLGGNVFGWTIDERQSFAVLDAFVDHGFHAIDTADCYSAWAPGNQGGESETIIGTWLKARPSLRDKVKVFTKVGSVDGTPHAHGLSEDWILKAVDRSLMRLGIESIDLYFSHWPDPAGTSYAETLGAFGKLIEAGKVKAIGASNLDAAQLGEALSVAKDKGLPAYQVLQPQYNLHDRAFEGGLSDLVVKEGLGVVVYHSLAAGFLSGKYRTKDDLGQSQRGVRVAKYLNPRGEAILSVVDEVSARHGVKPAEVALAWLMTRRGVTAPIASATSVTHVESFARAASLKLADTDILMLEAAGT